MHGRQIVSLNEGVREVRRSDHNRNNFFGIDAALQYQRSYCIRDSRTDISAGGSLCCTEDLPVCEQDSVGIRTANINAYSQSPISQ